MASDIESTFSNKIANQIGKVDVLKANHHGCSGLSYLYLQILKPSFVIIPNQTVCNCKNAIAAYLKSIDCKIFCTGQKSESIILKVEENGYEFKNINANESYIEAGNGFCKWENKWFYLNNGFFLKGWQKLNWSKGDNWFYFNKEGAMVTGWQRLNWSQGINWFYFNEEGAMLTGLHQLDWSQGKDWFYFNEHGAMQTGTVKIENDGIVNILTFDNEKGFLIGKLL